MLYEFFRKIIKKYRENADKHIAFACRFVIAFMLLVGSLNFIGIFKISPVPLYTTVAVSILILFLPTLFYDILHINSEEIRYIILTIIVFQSGLLYTTLSYHTVIMLAFPVVLSCLYNEKNMSYILL